MAYCDKCGHQLAEGSKFCSKCGTSVERTMGEREGRKTIYDGEVHKCPNCGDVVDAYEIVCEACGFELRGRKITSVVHELSLKLEKIDNPQKKDELIRTFYIPNTKEDINEFFILALSNIKIGGMNTDAWMVKLEQAYQKAELSFGSTHEFERLKSLYERACTINRKNKVSGGLKNFWKIFKTGYAWTLLMAIIGLIILAIGEFKGAESGDSNSPYYMLAMMGLLVLIASWIPSAVYIEVKKNSKGNKK